MYYIYIYIYIYIHTHTCIQQTATRFGQRRGAERAARLFDSTHSKLTVITITRITIITLITDGYNINSNNIDNATIFQLAEPRRSRTRGPRESVHMYVYIYIYTHTCDYIYIYMFIYIYVYIYIYIYISLSLYIYIYTYIYIYIYIYTYFPACGPRCLESRFRKTQI